MTVTVAEAPARRHDLLAQLIAGDTLFLAQYGRIVAQVIAVPPPKERKLGTMAESVLAMAPDFDATPDDFMDDM